MTRYISRRSPARPDGRRRRGRNFGACAGPGSTAGNQTGGAPATGEATGEVSFAHWRAEDKEAFDKLIAKFAAKFPDIKVTQDISPSNDYQTQALNRLKGGSVGDAFPTFRGAQFEQFVKAGVYTDLTSAGLRRRPTHQPCIEAGKADGKQWGLPYQVVFPMPVANTDMLSSVGVDSPPQDWDGFLDMCDKIKSKGIIPLAWPGGEVGNAGQLFNSMVMNDAASRRRLRPDRGRQAQGHRRLVPHRPQAVRRAAPVLPAQRRRHGRRADPAAVRQREGGHAVHRQLPHRGGPGPRREVRPRARAADHHQRAPRSTSAPTTPPSSSASTRRPRCSRPRWSGSVSSPTRPTPASTPTRRSSTSASPAPTTPTPT